MFEVCEVSMLAAVCMQEVCVQGQMTIQAQMYAKTGMNKFIYSLLFRIVRAE